MDRRKFIAAGAAAGSLGLAGAMPAAFAKHHEGGHGHGGHAGHGVDRSLQGDFLDLTTPAGNREAWARLLGNTDGSTKYGWAEGIIQGVRPGEAIRDLVGFTMISSARLIPHEDGDGYRKLLREVGFYTDLETGEILTEWTNPYLNETVKVVPIANDPFNHTITSYYPDPPSYGGLNDSEKPPRIPMILDFRRRGDTLNLFSHINLFYPNALQPAKWPRESSGAFNRVTEVFLYQIDWNDMQDASKTSVEYDGTWSRTTPWLPWMLMGPTPGHCQYHTFMGATDSIAMLPQKTVAYVEEFYPKYLSAPDAWVEPSLSSLEHYARERQPAPLPESGAIPVAPDPELPAWFQAMMEAGQQGQ